MLISTVSQKLQRKYELIPKCHRSVSPMHHGFDSIFWLVFSVITAIMLLFFVRAVSHYNIETASALLCGILCVSIIDLMLTKTVFQIDLRYNDTFYFDCIVTYKVKAPNVHCYVVAAFPDEKEFVEHIEIESGLYNDLCENEKVRMYYSSKFGLHIKHIS